MDSKLESFVFDSRQASSLVELTGLYEHFFEGYGFDLLAHALICSQNPSVQNQIPLVVQNKGLEDWGSHYMENNFFAIDPIPGASAAKPGIYMWDEINRNNDLSDKQQSIFKDAQSAELHNGFTISVHGPFSSKATAVVASSQKQLDLEPQTHGVLNLASYQFHLCFSTLTSDRSTSEVEHVTLSPKEQEILKWAAQGLTKAEISERMNSSSHTVDYHTRSILKKLDAKNTCAAVVTAIKNGLILP